ncbi:delta-aminolevulinic acid dehydratase [Methanosarcina sp. A14]|uniref:Delta-aminolevulinic acid dehydratase n=1 Tax=Methanosarcina barkeri MS TaxID=1434108 RepID=A0A0E3QRJ8_METBA|nr:MULTISPECIES: porphobilinogen synthase [Methanosarcina]AKB53428.1 Porphobilinogen synthase [Methanosarcina barkeri MS]OED08809.1 delta-aminolevulinic acid dehydratase [Methanosarcina sp. A14]
MFPDVRLRRLRKGKIRNLVRETTLSVDDLVQPIFVNETIDSAVEIPSMPGIYNIPLSEVVNEAKEIAELGIPAVIIFGVPAFKDAEGSSAYGETDVVQEAVRRIKAELGDELVVITDVCMCEYTSHGHCGIVDFETKEILNDPTLEVIGKIAVSHAKAGADMVAPSCMMDGMVEAIRHALDTNGFENIPIMSYAAKYHSCFYGPFREAAESGYSFGDRSTYQMDPANSDEAIREVTLDVAEGADILIVKPALPYLDIVYRVKVDYGMPTAAYNVSGEYSMIKAAAANGWLDEEKAIYESLISIKRAGADIIITYFAKDAARMLK